MQIKKAYEIKNAKIKFVSLVDKAANLKKFLITKTEKGKATFTTYGRIIKADSNSHFITGVVYEPMTEDAHGNYMTEDEITKAAYYFAKNKGGVDLQHSFEPLKGAEIVESWIAKADFQLENETIKKGTWLMTMEIDDPKIWEAIEKGDITGFSMGGVGIYSEEDTQLDSVAKNVSGNEPEQEKKGVFKKLAAMLGFDVVEKTTVVEKPIEKVGKKMSGVNREALQTAYNALGTLLEAVSDPKPEDEEKAKEEAKEDSKANEADADSDKNSEEKNTSDKDEKDKDKEEKDLTKAEVEKLVQDTVAEAIAKAVGEQQPNEVVTKEMVQEMVSKAVTESIEPVLKARGVPSAMNDGAGEQQPVENHYLHGIL